ncbi:MAG: translation initiation factor eIF-2B [Promethearchaeota archaeon]
MGRNVLKTTRRLPNLSNKDFNIPKMLTELTRDNTSGANELVFKALEIFKYQLELIKNPSEDIKRKIFDLSEEIISSRPSMAPLINTIGFILNNLESFNKQTIQERLDQLEKDVIEKNKALGNNFQEFLSQFKKGYRSIMLISYSSTIVNLLSKFNNENIEIYVLESRPLLEGRKTAEILSKYFKTHLIIDAAIGKFIDQIDIVLIGVDSILKDGSIINKIGTFPLALVAKVKNIAVYAITSSFKYNLRSHFDQRISINKKPMYEIYDKRIESKSLEVENYYFDITPPEYITGIISEYGILSIKQFLEKVQLELPSEWFKYFLNNKRV